jgi:hypothetical protein
MLTKASVLLECLESCIEEHGSKSDQLLGVYDKTKSKVNTSSLAGAAL